jgi:peptide deformylase
MSKTKRFTKQQYLDMIRKFGDPILKTVCMPFKGSNAKRFELSCFMSRILFATDTGCGLAANQVGINARVIVVRPYKNFSYTMFNPVIDVMSTEEIEFREGCLSYPGKFVVIKRPIQITVEFTNENGKEFRQDFKDFEARIIQHEIDHLKGICKVGEAPVV